MSTSAGLFATLRYSAGSGPWEVLQGVIDAGWKLNDEGRITYLPCGDTDEYDWQSVGTEKREQVLLDLRSNAAAGNRLGVVVTWANTGIGGELLLQPSGMLIFGITIHRRLLACGVTDVSWYIDRLARGLDKVVGITVEGWRWEETR